MLHKTKQQQATPVSMPQPIQHMLYADWFTHVHPNMLRVKEEGELDAVVMLQA